VDILPPVGEAAQHFREINEELRLHSAALAAMPQIVVANKMDLTGADEALERFAQAIGHKVIAISAATGAGLKKLTERLWLELAKVRASEEANSKLETANPKQEDKKQKGEKEKGLDSKTP